MTVPSPLWALTGFSIGYGLGAAFESWPGGVWASGVGLILALATLTAWWTHARRTYR